MEKTITANELKNDPNVVLREVSQGDEVVFVESPEAPTAAIISLEEYRRLREVEDRQRRQEAYARFQQAQAAIQDRLRDLGDDERETLAEELSLDTMERIIAKGNFRFVE